MEIKELLSMDANKVRHTPSLMSFYIETFIGVFGRKPNCAGCTFAHDFRELKSKLALSNDNFLVTSNNINNKNMEKTFKLKTVSNRILKFIKNGSFHRSYDNKMSEDFAVNYLTNGSPEELEGRKKEFSILPEAVRSESDLEKVIEGLVDESIKENPAGEPKTEVADIEVFEDKNLGNEVRDLLEAKLKALKDGKTEPQEESLEFEETPTEEPKAATATKSAKTATQRPSKKTPKE